MDDFHEDGISKFIKLYDKHLNMKGDKIKAI